MLEQQFTDLASTSDEWLDSFELNQHERELAEQLYQQKIKTPNEWITLTKQQLNVLKSSSEDLEMCWESLSELKIRFPS